MVNNQSSMEGDEKMTCSCGHHEEEHEENGYCINNCGCEEYTIDDRDPIEKLGLNDLGANELGVELG